MYEFSTQITMNLNDIILEKFIDDLLMQHKSGILPTKEEIIAVMAAESSLWVEAWWKDRDFIREKNDLSHQIAMKMVQVFNKMKASSDIRKRMKLDEKDKGKYATDANLPLRTIEDIDNEDETQN